jgi:hypothetical protein
MPSPSRSKQVCEYCLGVITAPSKRVTLERTVAIHIENCPAAHRGRKPVKFKNPGTEEWGPQHMVSHPVAPRKRVIPRQVLD